MKLARMQSKATDLPGLSFASLDPSPQVLVTPLASNAHCRRRCFPSWCGRRFANYPLTVHVTDSVAHVREVRDRVLPRLNRGGPDERKFLTAVDGLVVERQSAHPAMHLESFERDGEPERIADLLFAPGVMDHLPKRVGVDALWLAQSLNVLVVEVE